MEIFCEHCGAKLKIPDEKIPAGKWVAINCPKCKKKISLGGPTPRKETVAPPEKKEVPIEGKTKPSDLNLAGGDEDEDLEFYEEGVKPALIIFSDSAQIQALIEAAEELSYRCVQPKNTRDAISKLRYHHYDLIVLSERYDGIGLRESPVLQYLNNLSMSTRRKVYLALIGDSLKTLDYMEAYALSANLVINSKDVQNAQSILKHGFSDNDKFYKVFKDCLAEVGKA